MDEAKALKYERLYLFTPDKMHFYRDLGWKEIEQTEYCGKQVTIMEYEVSE